MKELKQFEKGTERKPNAVDELETKIPEIEKKN